MSSSGSTVTAHRRREPPQREIPFWNVNHRKMVSLSLDNEEVRRDLNVLCIDTIPQSQTVNEGAPHHRQREMKAPYTPIPFTTASGDACENHTDHNQSEQRETEKSFLTATSRLVIVFLLPSPNLYFASILLRYNILTLFFVYMFSSFLALLLRKKNLPCSQSNSFRGVVFTSSRTT